MKEVESMGYEESYEELKSIVEQLENDDVNIDNLTSSVDRAMKLVKHCTQKLHKTEVQISELIKTVSQ